MVSHEKHNETVKRARRDLNRTSADADTLGSSAMARIGKKAADQMSASDVDQNDRIELWGTRIGRGLGLVFAILLIIHLLMTYVLN